MRKKKGRKHKASPSENQQEPEDGEIIEESDETTSSSSSITPPENEIMASDKASSKENSKAAIAGVTTSDQAVIETEKTNEVAIGSVANSHQAEPDSDGPTSSLSPTTILEKETIAPDKPCREENSKVAIGSVATPNHADVESNKAAIGSVASSNQADVESEESSKVAIGSVATSLQANADSESSEETPTAVKQPLTENITDWSTTKDPDAGTVTDADTDAQQETLETDAQPDIHKITYAPIFNALPDMDETPTTVRVANISTDTTEGDLNQLLGLRQTKYLRDTVSITLHFNCSGKYRAFALIRAPRFVCHRLCELNGHMFNNRHLLIEILHADRSNTPYDRRGMLRGSSKQSHSPTSGNKVVKGYSRPAPNASSRQEDSVSPTSRVVDETQERNSEEVGGGQINAKRNRSMAQVVSDKHNRRLLEERKRCQLHIDIHSRDEGAPPPSASMIYEAFTEQLGLSKDPSNGVKAIYAPNPENSWIWLILFNTENLKTNFQGKTTTRTFTHKETKTDYTYTFKTRTSPERLLITIRSSPLIPDEELGSSLEQFGKITAIVRKKHDFAKHIDSGIRLIFLILYKDVKTTDIPGSLRTSDGVWRKLFFQGKSYMCKNCGTKHTHTQGCPTSQQYHFEQQQNYSTSQEHSPEVNSERTDAKQQTRNNTNAQHNPTNTGNTNHGHEEHTTTNSGRNRTHPHIQEHTNTEQQPNNFTEDQSDRGADYTAGTYTNSQEEDFPQSPCLVSNTRNCSVASPPVNDRDTKLQKSMEKVKTKQTGILRRTVKLISPLHNASRSGRKT